MHNKQISLNPNTSSSQHRVYSFCQVQVWILIHFSSLGCLWNPHPHAKGAYLSHTVTTIPTESAPVAIVTDLYGNGCNSACFEMLQMFNKLVWKCETFWNWWQRLHAYLNLTLKLLSVITFFSITVDSMKQAWSWIFSKTSDLSPSCRNFIPERVLVTSGGAAYNARSTLMLKTLAALFGTLVKLSAWICIWAAEEWQCLWKRGLWRSAGLRLQSIFHSEDHTPWCRLCRKTQTQPSSHTDTSFYNSHYMQTCPNGLSHH